MMKNTIIVHDSAMSQSTLLSLQNKEKKHLM